MKTKPRVALIHDFLREYGGAERVVEALHEMFPDAPLYTAFVDKESMGIHWKKFQSWKIIESWAASIPGIQFLYSPLRMFAANFFESFNFQQYDLVISSTNMYMAKAVKVPPSTKHLCYCHTPPRSLYGYTTMTEWKKNPVTHVLGTLINHYMRIVDFNTAQRPNQFIANSQEVQRRIQKFYRRESVVIYPPINVPQILPKKKKEDFCLFVGRLAASKHVDLVVRACTEMKKKLVVVGSGKPLEYLQSIAGPTVTFLGSVDDAVLHDLYSRASMLIYPAEDEDFGMIPVEAMAYGTPVIVHHSGG
ncbi:MAG TPA: glycosyltransferase, partial [Patescibacteria group bacterium]|nr:glycosyltransferase [Patescibacteria group bacterium]